MKENRIKGTGTFITGLLIGGIVVGSGYFEEANTIYNFGVE